MDRLLDVGRSSLLIRTSLFCIVALITIHPFCLASWGDRSNIFVSCVNSCISFNCSNGVLLENVTQLNSSRADGLESNRSLVDRVTLWMCDDDCKYACMWRTVAVFQEHLNKTPQFGGKWPFVRWGGMQEPASVIFSMLNLFSFVFMLVQILISVPKAAPMYSVWLAYSAVGIAAWLCSIVFHTRDTLLTEKLDYYCAFAVVMFSLYCSIFRLVWPDHRRLVYVRSALIAYFLLHIAYLSLVKFDYGYNMAASVAMAIASSASWLYYCWLHYGDDKYDHLKYCLLVIVSGGSLLSLEVMDFPPILWTFDAHSLWHLGTSPLPVFWAKFIIQDSQLMLSKKAT